MIGEGSSKKTWEFNFGTKTWTEKGQYTTERSKFGCATFKNKAMSDKTMVALVGGTTKVEFYDVAAGTWSNGPDLPADIDR